MRKDILFYNMEAATLSYISPSAYDEHPRYLSLHVPGLGEKRPSVLVGDAVVVSEAGDPHAQKFKVFVHRIQETSIYLKFSDTFYHNFEPHQRYKVEFDFSRKMLSMYHQGLSRTNPSKNRSKNPPIAKWLFPGDHYIPQDILVCSCCRYVCVCMEDFSSFHGNITVTKQGPTTAEVDLINESLNYYQKKAVRNIVHAYGRQVPYIVFGPPGTGSFLQL